MSLIRPPALYVRHTVLFVGVGHLYHIDLLVIVRMGVLYFFCNLHDSVTVNNNSSLNFH